MTPLDLLILSLFTWYVSYILVKTDGPFQVFAKLRARVTFGGLLLCLYCTVFWVALTGYVLFQSPYVIIVYAGAMSGGAMILHRYTGGDHG